MATEKDLLKARLCDFLPEARVRPDASLARHCNWKAGGPADVLVEVHAAKELIAAVCCAHATHQPVTVLGFGANVLVSDAGIRGLVVLNRAERLVFRGPSVDADSGTNLALLAKKAAVKGVGGLEFLVGIPGTVGAAVYGNAGTGSTWISKIVEDVQILKQDGSLVSLSPEEMDFSYRHSRVKSTSEIIVSVRLKGFSAFEKQILKRMDEFMLLRKNQPGGSSTGSVFKNPVGDHAGRLIEAAGLKGYQIGGAEISAMHANFILNKGGASASDIRRLIEFAKFKVYEKFSVSLKEEIQYLGDWS